MPEDRRPSGPCHRRPLEATVFRRSNPRVSAQLFGTRTFWLKTGLNQTIAAAVQLAADLLPPNGLRPAVQGDLCQGGGVVWLVLLEPAACELEKLAACELEKRVLR